MASLVVLTGAGVSAESGIPTFRATDGLWEGHDVMSVASPRGFARDPALVHQFYNLRRAKLNEVKPNAGHLALARLEAEWKGAFLLITQNVDDLHERAGSRRLLHMHGELRKARCEGCMRVGEWLGDLGLETKCPGCRNAGGMRPHIVWFEEVPFHLEECFEALRKADIFLCVGTSGQVYPAAGFVGLTALSCRRIEVNMSGTEISAAFQEHRVGAAAVELPKLVEELLRG
jgi:NAD-dependent deacetylase